MYKYYVVGYERRDHITQNTIYFAVFQAVMYHSKAMHMHKSPRLSTLFVDNLGILRGLPQ